jgi:Zn-dependent peptidase ImmA (M78 family)/DNA-binding XRE family transcriptional regulator
MNTVFAYRLKTARILRGVSIKQITENLGISRQMVSKYETGKSLPDGKNLIALAHILKVKPDYFFTPSSVSLDPIKFRKKAKTSQSKLESIKINILNQMENYLLIEDILSVKSEFTNPLKNNLVNHIEEVEDLASQLRLAWNIGNDPISNVISLLEANEIKIVEIDEDIETSFDGLSVYVNDKYPAIVVNKNYEIERKRFTLFHELGHLLLNINEKFSEKEQEKICDRFAGAVLLPKNLLLEEIGLQRKRISLTELINFQKQFGISIPAIVYRLVALKIIPENKIKSFYIKQNTQADFKNAINEIRFLGDEKSERFKRLVYKALSQDIISISKSSALLGLDIKTIQSQLTII